MTPAIARRIAVAWLIGVVILISAFLITQAIWTDGQLWWTFHLDGELNAPAWFSSIQLSFVAWTWLAITAGLWNVNRRAAVGTLIVVVALLFMSFDEATALHEQTADANLDPAIPRNYWVFFYLPIVVIVSIAVLALAGRMLLAHRAAVRVLAAGAAVYGFSVAGLEVLPYFLPAQIVVQVPWPLIEELGEMLGVTLVLYGSLLLLADLKQPA